MKDFLKKIIEAKEKQAESLRAKIKASSDANEVRTLGDTLEAILKELAEAKAQLAALDEEASKDSNDSKDDEGRSASPAKVAGFNPAATYVQGGQGGLAARAAADASNVEARLAFAKYVTRGIPIPAEFRVDATTKTTDAAEAIPDNLVNQIIEKLDAIGMVLPLVTKTSYKVGQSIPVDGTKPTASWVAEGASSDAQKKTGMTAIVFGAFKLRCEISMTQEVTVQTLPAFEALFIKQVSEAMTKAIESKIVSNNAGTDSPAGILYNANESTAPDKKIEIAKLATGHLDFKTLCAAEAELPQQYEGGAKWFMSKKTFMSIYALTDTQGQPIGRINYGMGGKPERTLLGRDVVLTGSYLPDYSETTATEDVCCAFLFDPSDYVLNTSYDLGIKSKEDWDTEDVRVKAVMSVDGKVIDRSSLVKIIKKYQ